MIKVIAIDFDYTLVGTKVYDEFFANTLFRYLCDLCNGGVAAGIITGRPFSSLEKKFISLDLDFYTAKFPSFIICKETYVFIRKNNILLEDHAWNKSRSVEGITVVKSLRAEIENIFGMLVKRNIDPVRCFYDD